MQLNISFLVWQSWPGLCLEPNLQPENQCLPHRITLDHSTVSPPFIEKVICCVFFFLSYSGTWPLHSQPFMKKRNSLSSQVVPDWVKSLGSNASFFSPQFKSISKKCGEKDKKLEALEMLTSYCRDRKKHLFGQ